MQEPRTLRAGEFFYPRAAEHRLTLCNNELITGAMAFAKDKLGAVPRKHLYPQEKTLYDHSIEVAAVVHNMFPVSADLAIQDEAQNARHARIVATAVLHDIIEDGGVDFAELRVRFGEEVAQGVAMLTENRSLPFDVMKKDYVERFIDPAHVQNEIVAISLADKFINVRDMNLVYKALMRSYKNDRLAKAIHYGAFWTPPTEAVAFYDNHFNIMQLRLNKDPRYRVLLRKYGAALQQWQHDLIPPETYQRPVNTKASYDIRELALETAVDINQRLDQVQAPMRIVVGGSTAYGTAIREYTDPKGPHASLHNIDMIYHPTRHDGTLPDANAGIESFFSDDVIHERIERLKEVVIAYCQRNRIALPDIDRLISFYWPE